MKPFAPACERNRDPILHALRPLLGAFTSPRVLEIGSGTGQHGVYFAAAMPDVQWIMSDREAHHEGIRAWCDETSLPNIDGPLLLDVNEFPAIEPLVDVVYSANTAHIMSWAEVQRMVDGVARCLRPGGLFLLYGPFLRDGCHTSASNEAFDRSLRQGDPSMGIRDLHELEGYARSQGLGLEHVHEMPANNLLVQWRQGS
ncbi:MAG: DUF938 domain-containing protein [Pseudomonadota bacterium]